MKHLPLFLLFFIIACAGVQALTPRRQYEESYRLEQTGLASDSLRADSLLRSSAQAGYAPAANLLGFRFFGSRPDSMLYWIEKAATAPEPDPKAFSNLGYLLSTGQGGVKRDLEKAIYWLRRGAEAANPMAMTQLAELLLASDGGEEADSLLERAASLGYGRAGQMLYLRLAPALDSLPADSAELLARRYYQKGIWEVSAPLLICGAGAGRPESLYLLAKSYTEGQGVPYDFTRANHYFWLAALAGNPDAARVVGETMAIFPDAFADERPDPLGRSSEDWLRLAEGSIK